MTGGDEGQECCRRRGRPRAMRTAEGGAAPRCYVPQCNPDEENEVVVLLPDEVAVLNLIDLQGLEQEEAAGVLGISRKTVWRDLHEAHRKLVDALIHGKIIELGGCQRRFEGTCPRKNVGVCPKMGGGSCPRFGTISCSDSDERGDRPVG